MRRSYPDFHPVRRGLKGQRSLQRHQMCAVMESEERGAFCEASDKPCSQSRPGSGVISGCTRGRNPNPAHRIGFLFTRACSPGFLQPELRPRTAGDRRGGSAREILSVCLPARLSVSAVHVSQLEKKENSKTQSRLLSSPCEDLKT